MRRYVIVIEGQTDAPPERITEAAGTAQQAVMGALAISKYSVSATKHVTIYPDTAAGSDAEVVVTPTKTGPEHGIPEEVAE